MPFVGGAVCASFDAILLSVNEPNEIRVLFLNDNMEFVVGL